MPFEVIVHPSRRSRAAVRETLTEPSPDAGGATVGTSTARRAAATRPRPADRGYQPAVRFDDAWTVPAAPSAVRAAAVDLGRRSALDAARVAPADDGSVVVTSTARVPTGARGFAVRLVGREMVVRRAERWHRDDAGGGVRLDLVVTVAGRPLRAAAVVRFTPGRLAGESRCTVRGTATAELPGVGGLVEQRLAAELLRALRADLGGAVDPAA